MNAPQEILRLVERFEEHRDSYRSAHYNETQIRREFIDPFFDALGWDVNNRESLAEAYKDVIHEDAIKVSGKPRAPDYAFRIGNTRMFFVEAKKPFVNVREEIDPAYQLRRYAWSNKLSLSILTDFEEFAVYDGRIKPNPNDKASTARVLFLTYRDYPEKWDKIAGIFSKQAVLKGAFDKFADEHRLKKGTAGVDDAFLAEIEAWRDRLARNIALRNPSLSTAELNYAVQRTIDRIIFLRICEDRGIEDYGALMQYQNGANIYRRLVQFFQSADERYNSGIFHFQSEKGRAETPDTLSLGLEIDDKVLRDIISSLYFPKSPYEFSMIPPEILGQVYEQFLGKVIRLTEGHQARVEDKPEVKKAGGVYYTPTYIVDYIVKNTVGKLLEGKTPKEISGLKGKNSRPLRILDPACGSGSFLLGAYQYLLDWYRDWYVRDGAAKWSKGKSPVIFQYRSGEWRLTSTEKKKILLTHIFGVDIDTQAVEVTKLSLLLKVLENETEESVKKQLQFFRERALPDLGNNIKCGNSLIGPDFDMTGLSDEERRRINPFDWEREFPEIMRSGGFDAVIGNPPYGATFSMIEVEYLQTNFKGESRSHDSYELFLLRASKLLNSSGRVSMIIPASWTTGEKYLNSRKILLKVLSPLVAYVMPFDVFKNAYIDTAIIVLASLPRASRCLIHYFPKKEKLASIPINIGTDVPIENIRKDSFVRLSVVLSKALSPILEKLKTSKSIFGDWFEIQRGVQPYSRKKHSEEKIAQRFLHANSKHSKEYLPELQGNELSRYWISPERTSYLRYCDEIASSRPLKMFQGERIVLRRLLTRKFRLQASKSAETLITTDNVLNLVPRLPEISVPFALGIINSRLISWLYANTSMIAQKDDFPQVHISALVTLPIPAFDKTRHDRMVKLVEEMLELNKKLPAARTEHEKTLIQRQIESTDQKIDRLVYDLYGLTEAEIKLVEESGR